MQTIEWRVSELKRALAGFNRIVNTRSGLPALGCIRVEPQAQEVQLQVTDLDSFATCRIRASTSPDFPVCLVSLATLDKVTKTAKGGIALIQEGKDRFKLRHFIGATPVEQAIESLPIEEWPPIPQIQAKPFLVELGFKESFRQALECVGNQSTRSVLNGVCLDLSQPDSHCLVASDGRHLFSANTLQFPLTDSVVIADRNFLSWSGFFEDGDWLLAVEPSPSKAGRAPRPAYVQIQSQRWTFLTRSIEGQYPDWRQVMPRPERTFTKVKLTDEAVGLILDALPRMPGTDDSSQPVTVIVRSDHLILRSRPRFGDEWTEVKVPGASISGADQRMCLDRTFLTKALRFGLSEFEVQDSLSPVVFTAPGKKLLAMGIRSDDAPSAESAGVHPVVQPRQSSAREAAMPTETAPALPRPPTEQNNEKEQNTMMATNRITALPAAERGNYGTTCTKHDHGETGTAIKAVVEALERIKIKLRGTIAELNQTLDRLKAADKEEKSALKEVESVRATLRSLKRIEL